MLHALNHSRLANHRQFPRRFHLSLGEGCLREVVEVDDLVEVSVCRASERIAHSFTLDLCGEAGDIGRVHANKRQPDVDDFRFNKQVPAAADEQSCVLLEDHLRCATWSNVAGHPKPEERDKVQLRRILGSSQGELLARTLLHIHPQKGGHGVDARSGLLTSKRLTDSWDGIRLLRSLLGLL